MTTKINSLVLSYKGWFNLHTHTEQVNVILQNGDWTPIELDASKLKWFMPTEVYDKDFKLKMLRDEDTGEEWPVIEYVPFKGTLTGVIKVDVRVSEETGHFETSVFKEMPDDCQLVGFSLEAAFTNKSRRHR